MFTVAASLRRPATYLRLVFVLVGSALALSLAVLDGSLILMVDVSSDDVRVTAAFAVVVVIVPLFGLGLLRPVRQVEAAAAELLLGVSFPDGSPSAPRHRGQRVRAAVFFVLHVAAGGVTVAVTGSLVATGMALLVVPLSSAAGESVLSLGSVTTTGTWADAWMPVAGVLCVATAVAVPMVLGELLARAAPKLLGPSYAERIQRLEIEAERLASRNRIAREIHDSVGHALSLVTLQATAARKLLSRDPVFADDALETIESVARSATADLDHMLGLLRDDTAGENGSRTAPPDLTALDSLIAAVTAAGLTVESDVGFDPGELPGVVSRETYRIVQEGLTNALRHAAAASVSLRMARRSGRLSVTLTNPAV